MGGCCSTEEFETSPLLSADAVQGKEQGGNLTISAPTVKKGNVEYAPVRTESQQDRVRGIPEDWTSPAAQRKARRRQGSIEPKVALDMPPGPPLNGVIVAARKSSESQTPPSMISPPDADHHHHHDHQNQQFHQQAPPPPSQVSDALRDLQQFGTTPTSSSPIPRSSNLGYDLGGLDNWKIGTPSNGSAPSSVASSLSNLSNLDAIAAKFGFGQTENALDALRAISGDVPSTSGSKLITDFVAVADMNEKGMRKKKKNQTDAHGKKEDVQMEDEHFAAFPFRGNNNFALFCVFDGHAGKNAAQAAKSILPDVLWKKISQSVVENGPSQSSDFGSILRETFLETDKLMEKYEYEGCTATVALMWRAENNNSYVQVANVGDSHAFFCQGGKALQLTQEHKLSNEFEKQRLIAAGIPVTAKQDRILGLAVSRALGDHFPKQQEAGLTGDPYVSQPTQIVYDFDTFLVVASDGLWDVMSGQRVMDYIKEIQGRSSLALDDEDSGQASNYSTTTQQIADEILTTSLSSPKCLDNISIIVTKL